MQMNETRQKKSTKFSTTPAAPKRTRKGRDILASLTLGSSGKAVPSKVTTQKASKVHVSVSVPHKSVKVLTVDAASEGQRIDNFLLRILKGVPKSHIYRIVRSGQVRINGTRCKVETKLRIGDSVRIPPITTSAEKPTAGVPKFDDIPTILYEDDHLLVVDKPAGLASHGGSGIAYGLIERMRASRPELSFLELAHRLDKETSGLLILAKTRKALVALHEMMRDGLVHKTYKTLVKGDWVNDRQHVKLPLYKYLLPNGERRVRVDKENGQASHTIFVLLERFGSVSFLDVELKTGRTHQIRVHAQSQGHPLVGDDKYGDFEFNKEVEKGLLGIPFRRMFLHAFRLDFNHPVTGTHLVIESPLPKECKDLIEYLETHQQKK